MFGLGIGSGTGIMAGLSFVSVVDCSYPILGGLVGGWQGSRSGVTSSSAAQTVNEDPQFTSTNSTQAAKFHGRTRVSGSDSG